MQNKTDREIAKRTPEEMDKLVNAIMLRKMWEKDMARIDKIYERMNSGPEMSNRTLIRLNNEALKLEARWANKDHGF